MKATCDALQNSEVGATPSCGERTGLYYCLVSSHWTQATRVTAVTLGFH